MQLESIFIYGCGGHAKVVIDIVEKQNVHGITHVFDDDTSLKGTVFCRYPVVGGRPELQEIMQQTPVNRALVAIGDNTARARVGKWLMGLGITLVVGIHPSAVIGSRVSIGSGTVVMAGCVINPDSQLGDLGIVNTGATVDHDCHLGTCVHIAPGCRLCGGVTVGSRSLLGVGTVVAPGIRIGCDVVVGAGSVVVKNIPDKSTVAGNPCRPL